MNPNGGRRPMVSLWEGNDHGSSAVLIAVSDKEYVAESDKKYEPPTGGSILYGCTGTPAYTASFT